MNHPQSPIFEKQHLHVSQPTLRGHEREYLLECLNSTQLSMAYWVRQFESYFADWLGVKHALATSSGTSALHLALAALDLRAGDEVIVPALTYVATANAVRYTGAKPVFADIDPVTWCIAPGEVERAITERTKAIIPVHLYGVPANMTALCRIAEKHNLAMIEDACESLGAWSNGRKTGTIGKAGVFSFYGNKTITTGEGGMVVTNDDLLAARVHLLRGQGQGKQRYWHEVVGYNYRMTDLQAAVGCAQLEQLDAILDARNKVMLYYRSRLNGQMGYQAIGNGDQHGNWAMAVQLPVGATPERVAERLLERGIETRPVFPPLTEMKPYFASGFAVAKYKAARGLVLPTHAELSVLDVDYICDALMEAVNDQPRH